MFKKVIFLGVCFFVMVAAVGPDLVAAGVDPLASPTPQPTERIAAPEIIGINPVVAMSEGNQGESQPSDILIPNQIYLPFKIDLPGYVDLAPLPDPAQVQRGIFLDVPQRLQSAGEVSCGPAALGMALDYLRGEQNTKNPSTEQLKNFLLTREMMYEWGTGVEELAYGARHYGFPGSYAFHDWTLEQLAAELNNGYPVVLSLGTNGPDQPGHFVTLTGLAADGSWVRVNDPLIGEVIYSREEFQELWGIQGNSGLVPLQNVLAPEVDPLLPWVGVFSALSMLGLMFTHAGAISKPRFISDTRKWLTNPRRKGIGGGPLPPEVPETLQIPRYEEKIIYMGLRTIQQEVPVYETRQVKVGIRGVKKEIPQYKYKKVQVGYSTITKNIPIYKTEKVKTGTSLVKKEILVTKYRTRKVLEWKKFIRKIPDYHYIGSKRFLVGYKTETRWKRVLVNKRVPFQTTKTITHQVPVYKEKKVVSGYRTVMEKAPKYEQQKILVGYKTILESEPVFEEQRVQVGTKIVTRQVPDYRTVRVPVYDNEISGSDPSDNKLFEKLIGGSSNPVLPVGNSGEDLEEKALKKKNVDDLDVEVANNAEARKYEVTDVVYLKGGPGAKSYGVKAEDGWSRHQYGGPSLPGMKGLGLLNNILVWISNNTKIIELMGGKPDAKAIILYQEIENGILIDEIRINNLGNEKILVGVVQVKITEDHGGKTQSNTIKIFPSGIPNYSEIEAYVIETDTKSFSIRFDDIELLKTQIGEIYIWMETESKRSGSIKYQINGNTDD